MLEKGILIKAVPHVNGVHDEVLQTERDDYEFKKLVSVSMFQLRDGDGYGNTGFLEWTTESLPTPQSHKELSGTQPCRRSDETK
jgi:hypothetical protein